MRYCVPRLAIAAVISLSTAAASFGQRAPAPTATPPIAPVPATKLEAFKPAAGSVVTFGFNELGDVRGISVDVREVHDTKGTTVRGLVVQVHQSEYREERSFVDADEIPELIKGIDAIVAVKANPTSFENFEVRYSTRGDLRITAFSSSGKIKFSVDAGRAAPATRFIEIEDVLKLRSMFVAAQQRLAAP